MVILNITSQVAPNSVEEWLKWMQFSYVPEVLSNSKFTGIDILKLSGQEGADPTFAVQHKAESSAYIQLYLREKPSFYQGWARQKFQDNVLSFQTELELISQHS